MASISADDFFEMAPGKVCVPKNVKAKKQVPVKRILQQISVADEVSEGGSPFKMPAVKTEKRLRPNVTSQNVSKETKALSGSGFMQKANSKPPSMFNFKMNRPALMSVAPDHKAKEPAPTKSTLQDQLTRTIT